MLINELKIKGFRSLKDTIVKPGKLNVLIGPNGSGKSNLLRFLELISAAADRKLSKNIVSVGGMESVLWNGSADSISFVLNFTRYLPEQKAPMNFVQLLEMARLGKTSSYKIQREWLCEKDSSLLSGHPQENHPIQLELSDKKDLRILIEREAAESRVHLNYFHADSLKDFPEDETILSCFNSFGSTKFMQEICRGISEIKVYHDIYFGRNSSIRQSAVVRCEKVVDADGQNLINVLHTLYTEDIEFRAALDKALKVAFNFEYEELSFPPAADQRIQMRLKWKSLSKSQSTAELSDGTLKFIFLMTLLLNPNSPGVMAIDEPENGLHPGMLPLIAEQAVETSERSQIFFSTHSPQFLDAFSDDAPTTITTKSEAGETVLKTLDSDALKEWLRHYTLGSLYSSGELENIK
jgi:predicted ATPase